MNILIVGLGLIGGSYALNLKKNHTVYGYDIDQFAVEYANKHNICKASNDIEDYIGDADVIFVCIYPHDVAPFINKHAHLFKDGVIISDVGGLKVEAYEDIFWAPSFDFVLAHPIAGSEQNKIQAAQEDLFHNANLIICPLPRNKEQNIKKIEEIYQDFNFKKITRMTPKDHDKLIAYTSQLTHIIAVSLMNSDTFGEMVSSIIGDSFHDLTRIAHINHLLWGPVFLENKDHLLDNIKSFKKQLELMEKAIEKNDLETLNKLMMKSTKRRDSLS